MSTDAAKSKTTLFPYLYFKGNAGEAIDFYVKNLNAKIEAKIPFSQGPPVAEDKKHCIMHCYLSFAGNGIMISDDIGKDGIEPETVVGSNVQLNINMDDAAELKTVFDGLSEGGKIVMPLEHQFWGATYGKFVDKFGITWSMNCHDADHQENKKQKVEATEEKAAEEK